MEENKPAGYTVFTYTGFDSDGDAYKFESLDDPSPFSIPTTGDWPVKLAKMLDFETQTQYTLDQV